MGWKNLPSWLKGVSTGILIAVIYSIIVSVGEIIEQSQCVNCGSIPIIDIFKLFLILFLIGSIMGAILGSAYGFIVGSTKMKTWLKGGLILSIISFTASLGIIFIISAQDYIGSAIETPLFYFALIFSFFTAGYWFGTGMGVANSLPGTGWPEGWFLQIAFLTLLSFVTYFIIGTIIGWIYGKIKSRGGKK